MAEPKVRFKKNDGISFPAWENNTIGHYLQIRDEKQTPSESAPLMAFIAYQGVADKGDTLIYFSLSEKNLFLYKGGINDVCRSQNIWNQKAL